jgi:hypothetical protein
MKKLQAVHVALREIIEGEAKFTAETEEILRNMISGFLARKD